MNIFDNLWKFSGKLKPQPEALSLKYFQKYPNAGDVFSLKVAQHYFTKNIIPVKLPDNSHECLMLLGSILQRADSKTVVCGAGFMFGDGKPLEKPRLITCVRGPLTGALLDRQGIPHPGRYADPGVLAPILFKPSQKIKHKIGIIPHYVDAQSTWIKACKNQGIKIIDVLSPLKKFFRNIQKCEVILSSSLHGLIFAHAYGKPAVWIELSDNVTGNGFKFFDYYESVGVKAENVHRIRIEGKTNPMEIVKLAQLANHSLLVETMEEAIHNTKRIIKEMKF